MDNDSEGMFGAAGFMAGMRHAYRKKYWILLAAAAAAGLSHYGAQFLTPLYTSTLTLAVEGAGYKGELPWSPGGAPPALDKSFLNTEYEFMVSRDMAERVAENASHLKCDSRAFRPDEKWGGSAQPQSLLSQISKGVEILPVRNTVLFRITATCDDPNDAKALVEAYAQEYMAARRELFQDERSVASDWMRDRLTTLGDEVVAAEARLQSFKEEQRVSSSRYDGGIENVEVRRLLDALATEQQKQAQLEPTLREIDRLDGNYQVQDLMAISRVREDPIVSPLLIELTGVTANLNSLKELYYEEHPEIRIQQVRYDQLVSELHRQMNIVSESLRRNLRSSQQTAAGLKQKIDQAKASSIIADRAGAQLQSLENDVQVKRQLYEQFLQKVNDPTVAQGFTGNRIRVSGKAYAATLPSFPKPTMFSVFAFALVSVLGSAIAFVRGVVLSGGGAPSKAISESFGTQVLGLVPYMRSFDGLEPIDNYIADRNSSFSEAIRMVRDSIASLGTPNRNRVTVLASAFDGEGKTTIALNLAAAFAQMQRVLVISADLSKLDSDFNPEIQPKGLLNVLSGHAKIAECIISSPGGDYHVLPLGWISQGQADLHGRQYHEQGLIASPRYGKLLSALSRNYDHVIIDTGSLKNNQASRALAAQSTHLLYIISATNANVKYAREGLAMVSSWNVPVAGVVLNKVEMSRTGHAVRSRRNAEVYSLIHRER